MAPARPRARHRGGRARRPGRAARAGARPGAQRRELENDRTVRQVAETVAAEFPGCRLSFGEPSADNRSYRVDFAKIGEVLEGFSCAWDVAAGAAQLHRVYAAVDLDEATFTGRGHTRLRQIEHLLRTGQVDAELFWTRRDTAGTAS